MKLFDIAHARVGLALARKRAKDYDSEKYPYNMLTLRAFIAPNKIEESALDTFLAKEELTSDYLTEKDDIIIRMRMPALAVHISSPRWVNLVIPAFMMVIKVKDKSIVDPEFLTIYLNSDKIQQQLSDFATGTNIEMISRRDLAKLEIKLPSLAKQLEFVRYYNNSLQEQKLMQEIMQQRKLLVEEHLNILICNSEEINESNE